MKSRKAFTIIELMFVIVVLGILAAVAIPRIGSSITDAQIARGVADVSAIRSAIIAERQRRLLTGNSTFIPDINPTFTASTDGTRNLLTYPLKTGSGSGEWEAGGDGLTFTYHVEDPDNNADAVFTYNPNTGTFNCAGDNDKTTECYQLTR